MSWKPVSWADLWFKVVKELLGRFVENGMNPVGSQLDHGTQNKFAQVHAWVRDCEVVSVDNEIIDSYDVDVD